MYAVVNDTNTTITDYTDSMSYMLKLSSNETYTITVYAVNSAGIGSAAEIQWPLSGKPGTVVKHHPYCKMLSVNTLLLVGF